MEKRYSTRSASFLFPASAQGVFGVQMRRLDPDARLWSVSSRNSCAAEALDTGCVDYVMNARELFRLFKRCGVDPARRPPEPLEMLFDLAAESQLAHALQIDSWQLGDAPEDQVLFYSGSEYRAVVCHNPAQARQIMDGKAQYDVIRVTA